MTNLLPNPNYFQIDLDTQNEDKSFVQPFFGGFKDICAAHQLFLTGSTTPKVIKHSNFKQKGNQQLMYSEHNLHEVAIRSFSLSDLSSICQ